jgi:plastocyanin
MNSVCWGTRFAVVIAGAIGLVTCGARDRRASAVEPTAVIEGVVTYRADPQRPWRYGRYYIRQAKTGELAEAVVAIHSRKLTGSGPPPPARTVTMDQSQFQFLPETIAIRTGDSVQFTNSDQTTHNVRATSEIANFNITMPVEGSHTIRFDKPGGIRQPIQVGCVFHSAMQAWIFVFDHPYFQLTPATGRFRLEGVPPGPYDLEMIHPAGQLRWRQRIDVAPGATLRVDIAVSADDKR